MSQYSTVGTSSATDSKRVYDALLHACLENDLAALARNIDDDNINAPVLEGLLPLQVAATAGHDAAVRDLVRRGAQVNATDNAATGRNTALHFAVLARRTQAVRALLDLGANPNAFNCVETTPMHDAARVGDIRVAEALIAGGADLMLENGYGNTALQRACLHNNYDMLLWIMRAVPAPQRAGILAHHNHAGYNVQDIATSRVSRPMVRLLDALGAQTSLPLAYLLANPYTEFKAWKAFLGQVQTASSQSRPAAAAQ